MKQAIFATILLTLSAPVLSAPRLLVFIVIDQMKNVHIERYRDEFSRGFKKLLEEGAVFSKASFQAVPTVTATGHATLLTGQFPMTHGIVGNRWWDSNSKKVVYAPTRHRTGLGPDRLLSKTLGDLLKENSNTSKVVSLAGKDRAAILMGGKNPDAVVWFHPKDFKFRTSRAYGAKPKWMKGFNKNLKKWGVPSKHAMKTVRNQFLESPPADQLLLKLAVRAVNEMRLGEDEAPDVLLLGLSATDFLGHRVGPDTNEMKSHLIHLDAFLGDFFDFLAGKFRKENIAIVLTSDHGVQPIPKLSHRVIPKEFKNKVEMLIQSESPSKKKWLQSIQFPNIYLNETMLQKKGNDREKFLIKVAQKIESLKFVQKVFVPPDFRGDDYQEMYTRGYHKDRSGQLVVRLKEGYLYTAKKMGTSHGSPYAYDTEVPLLMMSSDWKKGKYDQPIQMVDVLPTCAHWLGMNMSVNPDARKITEIVK